jgi:sugar phosphate isomerase/epimerase
VRFSICNELFEGWDFADICRVASELGYKGVEIAPFTLGDRPCELPAAARREMAAQAASSNVEIAGLHWLLAKTDGFHLTHPDTSVRDRTARYLTDLAQLCSDLGGRIMVFGSPNQRSILEGVTPDQARTYALDTLKKALPALQRLGIVLCLEPLTPAETNFLNTAASAADIIRELDSPNVRLILDVKAMSSEDAPPADVIRANRDVLAHIHANDANMRGPGFGNTDFVPIAAALRDIRYDGWVSVEVFDFTPDPVTVAKGSIDYLRKSFGPGGTSK